MGRKKIIKEVIAEPQLLPEPDIQPEPQIEPVKEEPQLLKEDESDTDSFIVATKRRILSDKTKDALKKGRDKLAEKWIQDREKREELKEKYAIKKANKIIKQKLKLKKDMGAEELDSEDEEPIKIVQPKKPKKQQVIVLPS